MPGYSTFVSQIKNRFTVIFIWFVCKENISGFTVIKSIYNLPICILVAHLPIPSPISRLHGIRVPMYQ